MHLEGLEQKIHFLSALFFLGKHQKRIPLEVKLGEMKNRLKLTESQSSAFKKAAWQPLF